jgi:hypothetical protein
MASPTFEKEKKERLTERGRIWDGSIIRNVERIEKEKMKTPPSVDHKPVQKLFWIRMSWKILRSTWR